MSKAKGGREKNTGVGTKEKVVEVERSPVIRGCTSQPISTEVMRPLSESATSRPCYLNSFYVSASQHKSGASEKYMLFISIQLKKNVLTEPGYICGTKTANKLNQMPLGGKKNNRIQFFFNPCTQHNC